MGKSGNVQYECRNEVSWKATLILVFAISSLWALVLFIPRPGHDERNKYFYLLLAIGLGIDLLILYASVLRRWAKTRIIEGVVHSDLSSRLLLPLSGEMPLRDVRELCFIFNASLQRKKLDYPNSKAFKRMKEELARLIDALVASRNLSSPVSLRDDKYDFPAYCGRLVLRNDNRGHLSVDLNLTLNRANLKEVRKFLSFLPKETRYTWRYGKVGIWSKGAMFF